MNFDEKVGTEIANTIIAQINALDKWALMAWGSRMYTIGLDEEGRYYLRFWVNGAKYKGYVQVVYRPVPDVYRVETYRVIDKKKVYHKVENEVYADELMAVIDEIVER